MVATILWMMLGIVGHAVMDSQWKTVSGGVSRWRGLEACMMYLAAAISGPLVWFLVFWVMGYIRAYKIYVDSKND